jgi:hypothetical protein
LQQILSEQKPLAHSLAAVQPWPIFLRHAPEALHVLLPLHVSASSPLVTLEHVPGVAPWHV